MKEKQLERFLDSLTPEQASRLTEGIDEAGTKKAGVPYQKQKRKFPARALIAAACVLVALAIAVTALVPLLTKEPIVPEVPQTTSEAEAATKETSGEVSSEVPAETSTEPVETSKEPVETSKEPEIPENIHYAKDFLYSEGPVGNGSSGGASLMWDVPATSERVLYSMLMTDRLLGALKDAEDDEFFAFTVVPRMLGGGFYIGKHEEIYGELREIRKNVRDIFASLKEEKQKSLGDKFCGTAYYNFLAQAMKSEKIVAEIDRYTSLSLQADFDAFQATYQKSGRMIQTLKDFGFILLADAENPDYQNYFMSMYYGVAVFAGTKRQLLDFAEAYLGTVDMAVTLYQTPEHPEDFPEPTVKYDDPFFSEQKSLYPYPPEDGMITEELQEKFAEADGKAIPVFIVLWLDDTVPDYGDGRDHEAPAWRILYNGRTEEETIADYMEALGTDSRSEAKRAMELDWVNLVHGLISKGYYYEQIIKKTEALGLHPENDFTFEYNGFTYKTADDINVYAVEMTEAQAKEVCKIYGVAYLAYYDYTQLGIYQYEERRNRLEHASYKSYIKALAEMGIDLEASGIDPEE